MNSQPKQQAFLTAYESCQPAFTRYCSALAYGKMDTEDLMQDVLVTAYKHFDTIENKEQLLHYLIRAARNRSISHWRKAKFKAELQEQHQHQLRAYGATPEVLLDVELLHQAMHRLPEKQKNALLLFEISGFSMKEIAEMQRTSVGAVKVKISRGRKKLRQMMSDKKTVLALIGGLFSKEAILARAASPTVVKSLFESCRSLPAINNAMTGAHFQTIIGQAATSGSWLSSLSLTLNSTVMTTVSISTLLITGGLILFQNNSETDVSTPPLEANHVEIDDNSTFIDSDSKQTLSFNDAVSLSDTSFPDMPKSDNFLLNDNILPPLKPIELSDNFPPLSPSAPLSLLTATDSMPPLFPKSLSPLFSDAKESLFPEAAKNPASILLNESPKSPKQPSLFDTDDVLSERLNIKKSTTSPIQNDSINCNTATFTGNTVVFRRSLLQKLKKDNLITDKKMVRLTFSGARIKVNGQLIPNRLQKTYQEFLLKYKIEPCPIRLIEITKEYVAVGDVLPDGFKGRIDGRVNIDELNNRKIN